MTRGRSNVSHLDAERLGHLFREKVCLLADLLFVGLSPG